MGMYDTVRCDYTITPEFKGECQTKTMDKWMGGSMSHYYIDPAGYLYEADTRGTAEWVRNPTKSKPWPYVRLQTGRRGRLRALTGYTDYVTIYPVNYEGERPEARLHIINGKVQSFTLLDRC